MAPPLGTCTLLLVVILAALVTSLSLVSGLSAWTGSIPRLVTSRTNPNSHSMACVSGNYTFSRNANDNSTTLAQLIPRNTANDNFHNETTWLINPEEDGNVVLQLLKGNTTNEAGNWQGVATTMKWSRQLKYGKVTARIEAGPGTVPGVVDAFITISPDGDEIDLE
ncbi:hypothetical protein HDU93_006155 [Gonapodya sp. JEL0774]|nr:hypothetical protein HDU93_006155 [Gonapodya sp. JEL0774]